MGIVTLWAGAAYAQAVVTSGLGDASSTDTGDWSYKLNVIDVVSTVRLITVSPRMRYDMADGADELYFVVYQETTPEDWELIWDSGLQGIGTILGYHDSPLIDRELAADTRYAVGWYMPDGNYTYFFDATTDLGNPVDLGWAVFGGSVWSAENTTYTLQTEILNAPPDDNAYQMQITVEVLDADGDGFDPDEDCDDEDATIFPGAPELCDGIDNDCTGAPDDPADEILWYEDTDADTWGDDLAVHDLCDGSAPDPGWVQLPGDCDDADPLIHPEADEYCDARDGDCDGVVDDDLVSVDGWQDLDGDGFGDAANPTPWCEREQPDDVAINDLDCDDGNPSSFPEAPEICDGGDNDCDGGIDEELPTTTFYGDADGDGFGLESAPIAWCEVLPPGAAVAFGDCDDQDPSRFPGNPEVCDGVDNDCDLAVPDDEADDDVDGFFACDDCADDDAEVFPGAPEQCDGVDRDCDGEVSGRLDCDPAPDEEILIPGCTCASSPGASWAPWAFGLLALLRRRPGVRSPSPPHRG